MIQTDVLVIGGGPAGVVSASTSKKFNPEKDVLLVREKENGVIPCGIPYIFNRLDSADKDILSYEGLEKIGVKTLVGKVVKIMPEEKKVLLEDGEEISFDKLILATGSEPIIIPIKGIDKPGVWQIKKDIDHLRALRKEILSSKNIVIIGGGFIGVEMAEELSHVEGLNVSIVEKLDHCLITVFDEEFAVAAESKLKENGVNIYTGRTVEEIVGDERVCAVRLDNGEELPADVVIISIGMKPSVSLVKDLVRIGNYGGIWVDEYMRTSAKDIFAVGDCAETRDFFTGKNIPIMLASTASTEARIAAINLYKLSDLRENRGTVSAFSTYVNGLVLGGAGISEKRAEKEGFDVVVGVAEAPNHHPGSLPNTKKIKVKLIFSREKKTLLGAQIMGPESISEMINILSLAIQKECTIYDFTTLQISTHPLLTAAPTIYPLITAAQDAMKKLNS